MHCIFDACVENACGDNVRAGDEACDDGDEADGDGCNARCQVEECGNGVTDIGEECDDGNADDADGCDATCHVSDASTGGDLDAGEQGCPNSEQLSVTADPLEAAVGAQIQVSGLSAPGAVYLWAGVVGEPPFSGGVFASNEAASTSFTCGRPGTHVLLFTFSQPFCPNVSATVNVVCTSEQTMDSGVDTGTDAAIGDGDGDGSGDAGGNGDGDGDGDADGGSDAGGNADGGEIGDGGGGACQECIEANCDSYEDINFAGPCFLNDPAGALGELEQPLFTQQCTDAVACSLAAPSGCADNPLGPFQCYCGNQTIEACQASGPLPTAECVEEWNTAARCPPGDVVCTVATNWSELTLPSGYAVFTIECANANCATQCGLTP